jgi:hypothetical protein
MGKGLSMKEARLVEACYFQPKYSGDASEKFWREIRHPANDRALYDFACALQDIEGRVLAVLNSSVRTRVRKLVIKLPSTRAATTAARFALLSLFMR